MNKFITAILGFITPKLTVVTDFFLFKWYRNLLLTCDLMVNSITFGDPRETVSSVLGKMKRDGTCKMCHIFCNILSFLFMEKEHCKHAIQEHIGRGTDNDMSPIPGLRRKWSNGFVIMIVLILVYKDVLWDLVGKLH